MVPPPHSDVYYMGRIAFACNQKQAFQQRNFIK